ncbi:50S ribosomal protein L19, partial [Candidatus Proelusimicrobium excrementi]|uniref:50S ribosomal protein L19 n=1 Tax=Candidatus Proelusimicrobium excrementi TaxID=3416222 RepID=UPI003D0C3003
MNMNEIAAAQLKKDLPTFKAGDTVRVSVKVVEGDNERIQLFSSFVSFIFSF